MAYTRFVVAILIYVFIFLATVPSNKASDLPYISTVLSEGALEPEFDYSDGPRGPANWGNIKPEWKVCNTGKEQSPINIVSTVSRLAPCLLPSYSASEAKLINLGYTIQVKWPSGGGWIRINGINFTLEQIHWHTPSEHYINGEGYDMEAHLVHHSGDKKAVIGILYKYGSDDLFLRELEKYFPHLPFQKELDIGLVNPMDLVYHDWKTNYYTYNGSLTTPPCTEGVFWTLLPTVRTVGREQVRTVGREQVEHLQSTVIPGYQHNARPLQALNHRIIFNNWPPISYS